MLAGAMFVLAIGRTDPASSGHHVPQLLLFGAVYGLAVLGLVRLFGLRNWGLAVAGLVAGPVPTALLLQGGTPAEERGGMLFASSLLGLIVGLLEWARRAHAARANDEP